MRDEGSRHRKLLPHARPGPNEAVDLEIRHHLEERVDRLVAAGMSPDEARQEAERSFGDVRRVEKELRTVARETELRAAVASTFEAVLQDLRLALRAFRRSPGFAVVVLLTLALGIGATTAVFSVVNAVLLRPFPYADPDRLVMVWESPEKNRRFAASPANFLDWRERNAVFEDMAAIKANTVTLTGEGEPQRVVGRRVSASFFPILGVEPALGRTFLPEEDRPAGRPVVILANGLWRRRFGADREILGQTVLVDETPHTVIGVMPQGFRFLAQPWDPQDVEVGSPTRSIGTRRASAP